MCVWEQGGKVWIPDIDLLGLKGFFFFKSRRDFSGINSNSSK